MVPPNTNEFATILEESFSRAEGTFLLHKPPQVAVVLPADCDVVFASQTQAYREVLLGCLLVRLTDPSKDVHLPYVKMGANAFSGRTLDEKVINPFLRTKKIPCCRGPYLSVFRRQVRFDETTRQGLKDQKGYDAFLRLLGWIASENEAGKLRGFLDYLLYRFVLLREESHVSLLKLGRVSLTQYGQLISGLLTRPSGGFFPVTIVLAMIETLRGRFSLDWQVDYQGINVADSAAGVGGDIVIKEKGEDLLTIEVTERSVDASRVVATFAEKIAPLALTDYVFAIHLEQVKPEAKQQAERYFAQGYDVNFVDIQDWLINALVLVGVKGRQLFQDRIVHYLSEEQVAKAIRVAWNEEITRLTI